MKNRIFHNWKLKLISLGCALLLWMTIYTVNDPQETKIMHDVPVTFVNTEAITDQGKTYEVLEKTDVIKSIKASAPRTILNDIKDSDIHVVADFSKYKLDGTVEIKIYSDRHNDDITFKASREDLLLRIEDRIERSYPIEIKYTGELKKGYIIGGCTLTPNRISISGGESYVNNVARVAGEVDLSGASGDLFAYANIVLYDKEGNVISTDKLTLGMEKANANVEVLATKTVPVKYVPAGTTAEGYVTVNEVLSDLTEVAIAGKQNVIAGVTEIVVAGDALTFENATENIALTVDIDHYLPEGISRADKRGSGIVNVTVQVSPVIDKEFVVKMRQIALENIPQGYSVKFVYDKAEILITLRGAEYLLNKLVETNIMGKADITTWMESRNMNKLQDESIYKLPPLFELDEGIVVTKADPIEVIANKLED